MTSPALPIDAILPDLMTVLAQDGRAVLQAPPGAGKTTRVPLAMLEAGLTLGRIVMLEPRRLAARAAADRMAATLGEAVGQTVGYRIRGETKVSPDTRIEVVTEGILTRMLQSDPELPGIGAVIFDEFHERSLNADLGLALCLEVTEALRDGLILLAMSATLDAAPVADVMQARILTSEGQSFDVTPHWLERPVPKQTRFEAAMADLIVHAAQEAEGGLLAFLPGEGEIRRVEAAIAGRVPIGSAVQPLFGAMDLKAQRAAVAPSGARKIVLATSIAETSLTIPDICIVVDGGLSRRAVFDPASGMSRLVTERVTRAEATQRAGRAGRVAPGRCFKLWTRGEDGALAAYPPPEIEAGDLAGFALELALWGGSESDMAFVTPPHAGRLAEARSLLRMLGGLDAADRITDHGRALARAPLHPRLAHMLERSGSDGALLAALLAERDPLRGRGVDLALRLRALHRPGDFGEAVHRGAVARIKSEAKRLARGRQATGLSPAAMAALAYPDRVGLRRKGDAPRYVLSGGKGAVMPDGDALAGQRLIVATDLDGNPREARVRQAAVLNENTLEDLFGDQIAWRDTCLWSRREARVLARRQRCFGALVLEDLPWNDAPTAALSAAMLDGVRQLGLRPSKRAARLMARAALMGDDFPDLSEPALRATLEDWLLPFLDGVRSAADWKTFDIRPALEAHLGWDNMDRLNRAVPPAFVTPLGRKVPIDYDAEVPGIAVRLQEMFGVTTHPMVGARPLQITLLSPAQRPVQVTADLPGFWANSYADVRKDMRGQYPKHPWPEDPTQADPTLRAKPRR
ncbi:ATP-dependent helicase HrpB [uncultured Tateyamaria sp.]|uniref:ATP-dependent helicase HrpB n=1 Tax=Tateyamaria sp. 1078 TaxID=3417464 RepID=UPI002613B72E|nr:ATP-dependent helicase HrpB [uncultured Tateyamaria sp.]